MLISSNNLLNLPYITKFFPTSAPQKNILPVFFTKKTFFFVFQKKLTIFAPSIHGRLFGSEVRRKDFIGKAFGLNFLFS